MRTGDEIRAARERAGLTQEQLAQLVGVSMRSVGNWERGQTIPRNRLAKIEAVLRTYADAAASDNPLRSATDAELLAEIARRFARGKDTEVMGNAEHPAPMKHDMTIHTAEGQTIVVESKSPLVVHRTGWNDGEASVEPDPEDDAAELAGIEAKTREERARQRVARESERSRLNRIRHKEHVREGVTPEESPEHAAAVPEHVYGLAARNVGQPSRGEQLRARQDAASEAPDTPAPDEGVES